MLYRVRGMDRVELHFHLLPGVDDGPIDLAASLELAREAVADGIGIVTVTPHARDTAVEEIPDRTCKLRSALAAAGIDLEIRPGVELAWDDLPGLDDAILRELSHGPAGRRWLLLEAPLPGAGSSTNSRRPRATCAAEASACSSATRSARAP